MNTLSDTVSRELAQMAEGIAKELGVSVDVCRQHYAKTPKGDQWQIAINGRVLEELSNEPDLPANREIIRTHIDLLAKQAG